jgi:sulfhydrogenase subunit gamma (sulfur reductase)
MQNPYQPTPMYIARTAVETTDHSLKTFDLVFAQDPDRERFFAAYRPGQFCQLSIFGKGEASFGVASAAWEGSFVRFTINKIGTFTQAVHQMEPGDEIGMRGPLGSCYPIDQWAGSNVVIIGGGYAFTTLYALTKHLIDPSVRQDYGDLTVIYGAREPGLFLYKPELKSWYRRNDLRFFQTIDEPREGWPHLTGYVPTVTREIAPSAENSVAFVCGPPVMIKFTLPILHELGFSPDRIYTSLEKRMKCGLGKCGRCNVGPKYVCKDGPVFSFADLQALPSDL